MTAVVEVLIELVELYAWLFLGRLKLVLVLALVRLRLLLLSADSDGMVPGSTL